MSHAREDLGFPTPRDMCDVSTMTVAHKAITYGEPSSLSSLFVTLEDSRQWCDRSTRQDRQLRPPLMRSATGQRSFAYRAASLLNELHASIIELDPVSFKRAVKATMCNRGVGTGHHWDF